MSQESALPSSICRRSLHPIFGPASHPYSLPCPWDIKLLKQPLSHPRRVAAWLSGVGWTLGERHPNCSSQAGSAPPVSAPGLAFQVAHAIPEHLQVLGGNLAASWPLPLGTQFHSLLLCQESKWTSTHFPSFKNPGSLVYCCLLPIFFLLVNIYFFFTIISDLKR